MLSDSHSTPNHIKDTTIQKNTMDIVLKTSSKKSFIVSYTKTKKLITALYIVTDTIDNQEPVRKKLRELGVQILSDVYGPFLTDRHFFESVLEQIMSLLDIAKTVKLVSEMNARILQKEFIELKDSIQEQQNIENNSEWLIDFMDSSQDVDFKHQIQNKNNKQHEYNKNIGTRIGVQKGSTLLQALNDIDFPKKTTIKTDLANHQGHEILLKDNELKDKRRNEILEIIKEKRLKTGIEGVTITDIKNSAKDILLSCSEKTLQRELVSMVLDNVLYRTGAKRWSQYFIKQIKN